MEAWRKLYPEGVTWDLDIKSRPIPDLLDDAATEVPDRCLCDFLDREFTYRDIRELSDRAAKGFQALGVGKGVHVGLLLPNMPQYIVALFGILKAGGTAVNYSPLLAEQELAFQIEDSETDIMVTVNHSAIYPKLARVIDGTRIKKVVVCTFPEALGFPRNLLYGLFKKKDVAPVTTDAKHTTYNALLENDGAYEKQTLDDLTDEVAILQYTGGTTGTPKGAMLTHACVSAASAQYVEWVKQYDPVRTPESAALVVLPLFHIFGLSAVMLACIDKRMPMILHPAPDIGRILKDIHNKRPCTFPGVPTLFTVIANHPKAAKIDFSSLTYCVSGGAPLPIEVRQRFQDIAGVTLYEGYGLTETSPAATGQLREGPYKEGSCGLALPKTEFEIRSLDDGTTVMPPGETGELCIRGPQLMKGYWKRPEETAAVLRDGWLYTGDTGYLDDDGFLFLVDRVKDLIISSGYNVYPRHVEEAIYQHPAVSAVTVIGIPDDYRGEAAKAFVELREGATLTFDELKAFLTDKLAKYKMPAEMEIRDALPRTAVGKLSKKELIAEEAAKRDQGG